MKKNNIFWIGYSDLMTSMFFVMLVLFVIAIVMFKSNEKDLIKAQAQLEAYNDSLIQQNAELKRKLAVYDMVESTLKPLKEDTTGLFVYEKDYKRFTLAFDIKFKQNKYLMNKNDIEIYPKETLHKIHKVGKLLYKTVEDLNEKRKKDPTLKDVSYLLIISGYASKIGSTFHNYELSYKRALHLWDHWMYKGFNFEDEKFKGLIDLQISGNGLGGVGRFNYPYNPKKIKEEERNQRFIIQLVPKIDRY